MTNDKIELAVATIWKAESGVVHMVFKATESHDIDDAHQVVAAHNELACGERTGVLCDLRAAKAGADRAARAYYVSEESARYKTAMAMLVDSPLQRMLGNIFFRMNRPPYPSQMFGDEDAALAWLASFEKEGAA